MAKVRNLSPATLAEVDQQLQAFAAFHQRHPDSALVMHTGRSGGWELDKITLNLGIHNAVYYTDQYPLVSQLLPPESIADCICALANSCCSASAS